MNLMHYDLNLLRVASALFRHGNVSRAGKELGLSQSAVSHALGRLRDQFKDPMFVRVSKGVAPTEFARGVRKELIEVVERAEALSRRQLRFDPKEATGRISIATTDYFESTVMTKLFAVLAKQAPQLQISLRPTYGELPKRELESGQIDLAIAGFYVDLPEGFYQTKLFGDSFSSAVRAGHPLAKQQALSIENFFSAKHALITLQGDFRDSKTRKINGKKQSREFSYGSYSFTGLAWVLQHSDLVLTAPTLLLKSYSNYFPLKIWPCPVDLGELEMQMIWHAQTHDHPLRDWLRKQIRKICQENFPGPR
jgi:DNA-binding transcriptional LysR family regulator